MRSVTQLLSQPPAEQPDKWEVIYALLYDDLRRLARSQIRKQQDRRVSPTSLISETWLRLAGAEAVAGNRTHLMALIARAMRYVLLDEARKTLTDKRGNGIQLVEFNEELDPGQDLQLEQLLAVDQALTSLAEIDERLARVVELRYFGGFSEQEVADMLVVTKRTIQRDWRKAQAYLLKKLHES